MNNRLLRNAIFVAMGAALAVSLPEHAAFAASTDGSLVGKLLASDKQSMTGAEVTARNPETGFTRTVKVDADGSFRFPFLPVGHYEVSAARGGTSLGKLDDVAVLLGTATTADLALAANGTVEAIQVSGSRVISAIDVKSTESAMNITREELERLPVERDATSVAMLAPGVNKGDPDLGGVSFGGSSIAENTVYINGLNVTDFYKRIGFSEVPYAFYKEFQVKTGGYSVEFGRTTGGVINAVTRSGTNRFEFGTEVVWEPSSLQSSAKNHFTPDGDPFIISSHDDYDRTTATAYASGPIIQDKLFFFALYEARGYKPNNTSDSGNRYMKGDDDSGFWGGKLDWQINDSNLLEFFGFSDKDTLTTDAYSFDLDSASRGDYLNTSYSKTGGTSWAATYTTYLTQGLSAKALYGENERRAAAYSLNDVDCNRIRDRQDDGQGDVGCTTTTSVADRTDTRKAARLDFEWALGEHQLRFGLDHEANTSDHSQFYPGPGQFLYEIYSSSGGASLPNGGVVPAGADAYVRARRNEVSGSFETIESAYYLEDNWSVTPNIVLNAGLRVEAFDNKNSAGDSYIKMTNQIAPRFGFSWDVTGEQRSKIFANAGRYFLPVANVINIKQAGGLLDERTFYAFNGFETFEYNGQTYQRPILGAQLGPIDDSQGDGSVGDLRGEVDAHMDPVYQDEFILGFQAMIDDRWSWGVRGIYRKLHNAIDDMEISSNGIMCGGEPGYVGYVMGNPGKKLTVYTDTNCDGDNDGYVTIDTSKAGWALYDDDGNYVGERGYAKPKRDYKALEFDVDRAWDDRWSFNASYTLAYSKGNAEGPVNSDTDFADTGRTENFDDPWVNLNAVGYLPNDRRHQFKLRGAYQLTPQWQFGATFDLQSGRPISALGAGNPYDDTVYHSFYTCVENCSGDHADQVFVLHERGSMGRTPWTSNLSVNVNWHYRFSAADALVRLSVYNLFNEQRITQVDESLEQNETVSDEKNPLYRIGTGYQSPRYAQLTLTVKF